MEVTELHGAVPGMPSTVVHHLPVRLGVDGPAKVGTYFVPTTTPVTPDGKGACAAAATEAAEGGGGPHPARR